MMKKILLLGGSAQQVVAIETAKRLGYYTVLCDFLPDNPGQYSADKFYLVSTTDKAAILEVAEKEHIDGIIAYASDPAAPTAAYVAEKLGLSGNPYEAVETLCNKDKFREFLRCNGFSTPAALGFSDAADAKNEILSDAFSFPIIIKPVDSSGSKGATVLHSVQDREAVDLAIGFAFSFSRCKRIVVEEYIVKKHPYLIGGDIFVSNGQVVLWGLMNCHRDPTVNPLVPVGKSFPPLLDEKDEQEVRKTLQRMVTCLGIKDCPMNVELIVDENGRVFPIDIGPRSGGNMIPDLLGMIFDVDVVEMSVKAAMGEPVAVCISESPSFCATHNLHSDRNGIYGGLEFSEEIKPFVVKKCLYKKAGDPVEFFDNAAKALGIVFLKFQDQEKMHLTLNEIKKHIKIAVNPTRMQATSWQ